MSGRLSGLSERLSGGAPTIGKETVGTVGTVLKIQSPDRQSHPIRKQIVGEIVGNRKTVGGLSAPPARLTIFLPGAMAA